MKLFMGLARILENSVQFGIEMKNFVIEKEEQSS